MADSVQKVADNIKKLDSHMRNASSIQAVDLLTKEEIEELRALINHGDSAGRYAAQRMENPEVQGMYDQLSDSGFISCATTMGGQTVFVGINQKAHWAVARFDGKVEEYAKKLEEEKREKERADKRQWGFVLFGWFLGLISDPVKDVLVWVFDQLKLILESVGSVIIQTLAN